MAAIVKQRWDSRNLGDNNDNPWKHLVWVVAFAASEQEAYDAVEATGERVVEIELPSGRKVHYQGYEIDIADGDLYHVTAQYGKNKPLEPGDFEIAFDTTGGSAHVTQSLETTHSYPAPGVTSEDMQGAIGVNEDNVEGTDIPIRQMKWVETHAVPSNLLTFEYVDIIELLTTCTNAAPFRGKAIATVLFLGAVGGAKRGEPTGDVSFHFAYSRHAIISPPGGPISGIDKKAWEYLWYRYAPADGAKTRIKRPVQAYVERMFEPGDFSLLGIGTATA